MYDGSSSSAEEGDIFVGRHAEKTAATRRSMKSLFAEDAMQSKHGVTSLRYEGGAAVTGGGGGGGGISSSKAVSLSAMGGGNAPGQPPNAPSPLRTAAQAVVLTYKGDVFVGPCVVAVCVPNVNAFITSPLIAIVDREKHSQCRVRVDRELQLLQNKSEPQYGSLYDPSVGVHWSLMFKGRRECTEFVAAVHTTLHYMEMETSPMPPFVEWEAATAAEAATKRELNGMVSHGDVVSVSFMAWLLRRIPGTRFFSLGKLIEEVPPEAPREVVLGDGVMMVGVEEVLVGMNSESSRLVFLSPGKTEVRKGIGNPEVSPSDAVVVHITCHEVRCRSNAMDRKKNLTTSAHAGDNPLGSGVDAGGGNATSSSSEAAARFHSEASHKQERATPVEVGGDTNTLLQAILLQTLQQQNNNKNSNTASEGGCGESSGHLATIERGIDRVHLQLASLYEKIDRLGIDEKIAKNNTVIERIVKQAVGKAPVNDVDVEDMDKDRDSLLAVIENLKKRLGEATDNYHRALEVMGRHKDEVHRMQNDLLIQQETNASRVRQLEEQRRLQLVEAEVQHRQALERIADEKFREGRDAGFAEGVRAGRQEAFEATGGHSEHEWKERLFTSEQRIVELESEMQEQEARHIAERRRLQEQIDTLQEMSAKLEKRAKDASSAASHFSPDITARQCKTLRRAMNATYTNIESQLWEVGRDSVQVEDALRMVFMAVKSETRTFTDEIKKEAALSWEGERLTESCLEAQRAEETVHGDAPHTLEAPAEHGTEAASASAVAAVDGTEEECSVLLSHSQGVTATTPTAGADLVRLEGLPPAPPQNTASSGLANLSDAYPDPPELVTGEGNQNGGDEGEDVENVDKGVAKSHVTVTPPHADDSGQSD
ncbi:hypothetical protein DQ04_02241060 [Trypanosoma grayi]|uniref:hypothetical protein n=1 Tax=Trypanosoma grayi TaxID=71804 RepID=UPI0004F46B40|nr:hypothetical protein DQ04_02241060 [Trypanosoma grayi]KEG11828.1 hypothetical protein DQ04_02241060 [Trypanosoma grayi]